MTDDEEKRRQQDSTSTTTTTTSGGSPSKSEKSDDGDKGAKEPEQSKNDREPGLHSDKNSAVKTEGDKENGAGETDEEHGASKARAELLDGAKVLAAQARSLDAAVQSFGLQTNQQINNFYGSAEARSAIREAVLSERTLARVRTAFEPPDGYPGLWDRLEDHQLVLLSATRAGCGRRHTATYVLDALCDGRVRHLTSGRISDLDVAGLAENTGYLWTDLDGDGAESDEIEQLAEGLRVRGSRLVVLSPSGATWPFEVADHCHTLTGPPNLTDVFRLYLTSGGHVAGVDEVLADAQVIDAAGRLASVEAAARLGTCLRAAVSGGSTVAEALNRADAQDEGIAGWLAGLPEHQDRAFALALAALNGLSLPTVTAGARRLDELMQRAEDRKGRSSIRPLARPTRRLLDAIDATTAPGILETSYGEVPMTAVLSGRDRFSRDMLGALWHDFPYLQDLYLGWLDDLVRGGDTYVRDRAAVAAGILAENDFDFIRGRMLLDWAESDDRNVRRAAGVALRIPALNSHLQDIVWKMLEGWAAESKGVETVADQRRRMAAAAALGGPVGATASARALDVITDQLLEYGQNSNAYRYWLIVSASVVDLFGAGDSAQSSAVLVRVLEWAGEASTGPVYVAVATLIGIAGRPAQAGSFDRRRIPPLLHAASEDKNLAMVADLWRRALNHRVLATTSIRALRMLIDEADAGDDCADVLCALVLAIPRTTRELRTLTYETGIWSREKPDSATLERLHHDLRNHEVPR